MSSGKIGRLIFRRVPFFTFFVISLFLEDKYYSQNNEYRSVVNHPVQISDRNRPACMTRYNNIYNKNIVKKKSVRKGEGKREKFFIEFASEIDLYSDGSKYPEWVFEYREELLLKISPNLMKICSKLKDSGYDFKIKYPFLIDGKYKFADIYIPRKRTVIVKLSYNKEG